VSVLLTACAIVVPSVHSPAVGAESSAPPNIVLIMADDLGYGDIGCYRGVGGEAGWIATPNIDRMAGRGLRMIDFHSSGNVCSPTRAGLMTGRYQQRAGIPGVVFADPKRPEYRHGLQDGEVTLPEVLGKAGYATAIFGKWHLGYEPQYNPVRHGFHRFRGYVSGNVDFFSHVDQAGAYDWWDGEKSIEEEGYVTHLITKHAVEFINDHHERPFFLYLPHEAPHYPYQGPGDKPIRQVGGKFSNQGARTDRKEAYREMVIEMDKGVGQVLAALEKHDLTENTLVWFFSDNGATSLGSNGPLRGQKGTNWEGGHRVPSIAYWPGKIEPGGTSDQLAITLDVMPTALALAQTSAPEGRPLDGVDLAQVLTTGKAIGPRQLFWNGAAMRDGDWKLVIEGRGKGRRNAQGEPVLFNLADDIGEQHDLAGEQPERAAQMLKAVEAWRSDVAKGATQQPGAIEER
jgi:arylsulfatase A-like enzyme